MSVEIYHVAIKLTVGYILLFITTKIIGRQQLSQISIFDFISAMVLGEILGNSLYDPKISLLFVIMNLVLWTVLKYGTETIADKFINLRGFLEGKPTVIIRNSKIDKKALKNNKLNIHQLLMLIRQQGVFHLSQVQDAILEINGQLTVIKKAEFENPTRQDMNITVEPNPLPYPVVVQGTILKENLQYAGVDEIWLKEELRKKGYPDVSKVTYVEISGAEGLFILESLEQV